MSEGTVGKGISRRTFVCAVGSSLVGATLLPQFNYAQNGQKHTPPTPTNGPPPCEKECQVFPFILIARDPNDVGHRSTDANDVSLGVESPNVWFEDAKTGQVVTTLVPATDYVIATRVVNLGSAPTYTLCVDFLVWVSVDNAHHTNVYKIVSTTQGLPLVQNDPVIVRSSRWTPAFGLGLKPGDAIVRAYDPWADHYTVTGQYLYVNRDRHLAHKSYI